MKIDKSQVSGKQFMFTVAFYLASSGLLISVISGITGNQSYIALACSIFLYVPLILLFRTMMVMFPDKNLLEVLDAVYGRFVGKVIGIAYLWYFLTLSALNLRNMDDFAKITFMKETPHLALGLVCILVAVFAARNGFGVVSRYSRVFTIAQLAIIATSLVLLVNQMDASNLLPAFTLPAIKYVQSTHIIVSIPFGELVTLLMVAPAVKRLTPKEATKYWLLGTAIGTAILTIVLLRDILILGSEIDLFALPSYVTLRLVDMGEALSRMEIIFMIALTMLLFFKITVLCYVSTIGVAQVFKTVQYKHLALIVGVLILFYAQTLYPSSVEHTTALRTVEPFMLSLFEIVLPLLTFIIAKIRGLPKPAAAAAGGEGVRRA